MSDLEKTAERLNQQAGEKKYSIARINLRKKEGEFPVMYSAGEEVLLTKIYDWKGRETLWISQLNSEPQGDWDLTKNITMVFPDLLEGIL
jgi:hypothetical protein